MKPSSLIKDSKIDVGYRSDDFVQNRVTAIAKFQTAQGEHNIRVQYPLQMIDNMSDDELKGIMIYRINKFIYKGLFLRAFNMVKRLKRNN